MTTPGGTAGSPPGVPPGPRVDRATGPPGLARWLKVIDQTRCIGCHACTTACKSENDVPLSVTRTYVKSAEHPWRFTYILTRPQWRSWLVRGGIILAGYAAVLGVHLLAALIGSTGLRQAIAVQGVPLAALAAIYTAYLLAQAKARDLWQNPLLPHQAAIPALGGIARHLLGRATASQRMLEQVTLSAG